MKSRLPMLMGPLGRSFPVWISVLRSAENKISGPDYIYNSFQFKYPVSENSLSSGKYKDLRKKEKNSLHSCPLLSLTLDIFIIFKLVVLLESQMHISSHRCSIFNTAKSKWLFHYWGKSVFFSARTSSSALSGSTWV